MTVRAALLAAVMLLACSNERARTLSGPPELTPSRQTQFPEERSLLLELPVTSMLPADTTMVVAVRGFGEALTAAKLTEKLGKEPFTRAAAAVTKLVVDEAIDFQALARSGLDPQGAAGVARLAGAGAPWERHGGCRLEHATFDWLDEIDRRLEFHLRSVREAGEAGFDVARRNVEEQGDAGAVFTAAVLALERDDVVVLAGLLDRAEAEPDLVSALASALGWLPFETIGPLLPGLLDESCPAVLRRVGIAACAVHRHDPGAILRAAVDDSDGRVRQRALRAVGELGRADLEPPLSELLSSSDDDHRYWAAWSLTLLGGGGARRTTCSRRSSNEATRVLDKLANWFFGGFRCKRRTSASRGCANDHSGCVWPAKRQARLAIRARCPG